MKPLLLICLSYVAFVSLAVADERPNILLIFTDDQGIHDVGCYGSEIKTPHIDSLATQGLKFNNWYSASSICTPSRYGLLTGRNPSRSRDQLLSALMFLSDEDRTRGIHPGETTIAATLGGAGYQTALIGKWHLGHGGKQFLPTRHGFDYFVGHTGGCIDFFTMRYGISADWYRNEKLIDVTGYATDVIQDEAVDFLKKRDPSRPFFALLSFNAPHFGKGWNDGESTTVNQLQPPPEDLARVAYIDDITRRKYAAKVVNLDDAIGGVLDSLDDLGLSENTLVIFLTDHGGDPKYGGSNAPYRGDKATLFEGGIRVPCLMRWPRNISGGVESDELCWSVDLAPTLSKLAKAPQPLPPYDGADFSPLLRGQPWKSPSRYLYWQLGKHDELGRGNWTALRSNEWKYVQDQVGNEYLFDLAKDPLEKHNLVFDKNEKSDQHQDIKRQLARQAKAMRNEFNQSR